jgi:DNA repair protein RadC
MTAETATAAPAVDVAPRPTDGAGSGGGDSARHERGVPPDRWEAGPSGGRVALTGCAACEQVAFLPDEPSHRPELVSPETAAAVLVPRFAGADRERCVAALVDTKHRLLRVAVVSVGSLDHTFMAPREVFRDALLAGASAIFLAHNHPSGDPTPSADDRQITRRLAQAGATLGVDLLDHLVVGDPVWTSLARLGVL